MLVILHTYPLGKYRLSTVVSTFHNHVGVHYMCVMCVFSTSASSGDGMVLTHTHRTTNASHSANFSTNWDALWSTRHSPATQEATV